MATFRERVQAAITVYRHGYPWERPRAIEPKAAPFVIWPEYSRDNPQWRMIDLQAYIDEGFNINSLIYSAVMFKARAVISAPLRAYDGNEEKPTLLDVNHPLSQLVSRPNSSQSWAEFDMLQKVYFNLAGEAITWFDRRKAVQGVPSAMYPLNPRRVFIIPGSEKGKIKGYVYVPDGKSTMEGLPLLSEDVSHVKLPNPGDPLDGDGYGLSPISPLAHSGDVDNMITKFLAILFKNGAIPAGVLKFDTSLDDSIVSGIKERWKEMYGGYENWGEVGVLDRGGSYDRLGMNFDELGFDGLDERNETRILGPFGVPPILIGSRIGLLRSTYANYKEARLACWEDTLVPELGLFEADFRYYMQSDDGGFVAYDLSKVPALRKDVPALVEAWGKLVDRGVPKNTAAAVVGLDLPELPDGKTMYLPFNMVPIGADEDSNTGSEDIPNAEEDTRDKRLSELTMELKRASDLLEATVNTNGRKKIKEPAQ